MPESVKKPSGRRPARRNQLGRDEAQQIAVQGLEFLVGDSRRLERFVALSGLAPATLRSAAGAPGFLLAVLDHIAGEETLLIDFSAATGHDPREIVRAREILDAPQPQRDA